MPPSPPKPVNRMLRALLLAVGLLSPHSHFGAESAPLSNQDRLEYTRNTLTAHNDRILGGWQPPAAEGPLNRHYPAGRSPLVRPAYVKLPLGAVR